MTPLGRRQWRHGLVALLLGSFKAKARVSARGHRGIRRALGSLAAPDFQFDGSTSDLAQQLYLRFLAGSSAEQLNVQAANVPARVQARLKAVSLQFQDLPGLLQRAVLWDTGYVLGPRGDLVRVRTQDGRGMDQIAVTMSDFEKSGCTMQECEQPNGQPAFRSKLCNGDQMLSVVHCVTDDFSDGVGLHASMWSTGGDVNAIPEITVFRHDWIDNDTQYLVNAIHTMKVGAEPAWDTCKNSSYSSIVIPCYTQSVYENANITVPMADPEEGTLVKTWLKQHRDTKSSQIVWIIAVVVASVVLIAAVAACLYKRSKQQQALSEQEAHPAPIKYVRNESTMGDTRESSTRGESMGDEDYTMSNSVLQQLTRDPNLVNKRLPFEKIEFQKVMSKGAYGEVWLCQWEGKEMAIKRLLQTKDRTYEDVKNFVAEIQLSASLDHPNIVQFIGVAWTNLENLVMALEYLGNGDLQSYLRKNGDLLSWGNERKHLALGILRGIEYLHHRDPPLIHRDLKSRNVLLTARLDAKLIDFGVSRDRVEHTMTAGVGTPYWTAPEVLEGAKYNEKADIYSFGVMLSELDTCKLPYHNATTASGQKLKPFQILKMVMAGQLVPGFTSTCPAHILEIANSCLQHDPNNRPSAEEVIARLQA